jgi:hypothetical protein
MSSDVVRALEPVVAALEVLGVAYRVGGSVASSALGVPRSTLDVDLVTELGLQHAEAFAKRLADAYYVDADMIRDAIRRRASFNVVHLETMTKVDVFIRRDGAFDREVFSRNARMTLEDGARSFDVTTAEDIILRNSSGSASATRSRSDSGPMSSVSSASKAPSSIGSTWRTGRETSASGVSSSAH